MGPILWQSRPSIWCNPPRLEVEPSIIRLLFRSGPSPDVRRFFWGIPNPTKWWDFGSVIQFKLAIQLGYLHPKTLALNHWPPLGLGRNLDSNPCVSIWGSKSGTKRSLKLKQILTFDHWRSPKATCGVQFDMAHLSCPHVNHHMVIPVTRIQPSISLMYIREKIDSNIRSNTFKSRNDPKRLLLACVPHGK